VLCQLLNLLLHLTSAWLTDLFPWVCTCLDLFETQCRYAMVRTVKSKDGNQRRLAPLRPREYVVPLALSLVRYGKRRSIQQPEVGLDLVPENFPAQPPYQAAVLNSTTSHDSDQTIGSGLPSDAGTPTNSTRSDPTSLPARKRRITPQLVTPTSSVTSGNEHGRWMQTGHPRERHGSIGQHMSNNSLKLDYSAKSVIERS
jgi:hypothetical protein